MKVNLFNIQHFSVHDGPGIRTTIFFKGCPLDCAWCHNPEGKSANRELSFIKTKCRNCGNCVAVCPVGLHRFVDGIHTVVREGCIGCGKCAEHCFSGALELLGKEYTIEEIMENISYDDIFFGHHGGVTFSGGEPFMQFEGMYALLRKCYEKGYSVCIETSGFTSRENIIKAAEYTDWFLYDCKETDVQKHRQYVGQGSESIFENLYVLDEIGSKVVLRCPIIPGINDREEHFNNIALLADQHSCIKLVELMPYHPLGIEKSEQIGKVCGYTEPRFLEKTAVEEYVKYIKMRTFIPIK